MALHHVTIFGEVFDNEMGYNKEVILNDFLFDYPELLTAEKVKRVLNHMYPNISRVQINRE
jgi:hypothetical protein